MSKKITLAALLIAADFPLTHANEVADAVGRGTYVPTSPAENAIVNAYKNNLMRDPQRADGAIEELHNVSAQIDKAGEFIYDQTAPAQTETPVETSPDDLSGNDGKNAPPADTDSGSTSPLRDVNGNVVE